MAASGKSLKPIPRRTTHMVRLGEGAYQLVQEVYANFLKMVALNPELYPAYTDRRVTISEVVSLAMEAQLCWMNDGN